MRKTLYLIGAIVGTVLPYYYLFQFFGQYGFDVGLFAQRTQQIIQWPPFSF